MARFHLLRRNTWSLVTQQIGQLGSTSVKDLLMVTQLDKPVNYAHYFTQKVIVWVQTIYFGRNPGFQATQESQIPGRYSHEPFLDETDSQTWIWRANMENSLFGERAYFTRYVGFFEGVT